MKLKGIELKGTYKFKSGAITFEIYDEKGNQGYYEDSSGYWAKWECDEKGDIIHFENSNGEIIGERVKELTIGQIERMLGYKIKIKGE